MPLFASILASLIGVGLLGPAAAATTSRSVLPWSQLSLEPAAPDAAARGPELLTAGHLGMLAVCDPVSHEVDLIDASGAGGDRVSSRLAVGLCGDIAFALTGDLVILDNATRRLSLVGVDGQTLAQVTLPDLAPTGLHLAIENDQVLGLDLFGNAHPLASVEGASLQPARQTKLEDRAGAILWDAASHSLHTDGLTLDLPQARVASGQQVGDWLIVDIVVNDAPALMVRRQAWHVPTGQVVDLPVQGRLYAPHQDAAQDDQGRLVVLDPRADGLGLLRVSP
ncbi:MAG: hypothetical protein GXP62_09130 [Oligoflexia bacterium]|nr:hypothetical protein [Oligoflexia bacterium]